MKHLFTYGLLVMVFFGASWATRAQESGARIWKMADSLYAQGDFDSALVLYKQYADQEGLSAALHNNLGSTYFRLNEVGEAVLHFEKALFLSPGDRSIKENLMLARSRVSNRIAEWQPLFFVRWWEEAIRQDRATFWAVLSLMVFLLLLLALIGRRLGLGPQVPSKGLAGIGAVWMLLLVLAYFSASQSLESGRAVVMSSHAPLQASPEPGKPLSLIPEGTTVSWKRSKGGWAELTLPDGRKGWMEWAYLEKI